MDKLTAIINSAAASNTEYYASQQGIFFEDMEHLISEIKDRGFSVQRCKGYGPRGTDLLLVGNKVWMTKHGAIRPVKTANL